MKRPAYFGRKLQHLFYCSSTKLWFFHSYCKTLIISSFHSLMFRANPLRLQICYLLFISLFGFVSLKFTKPRTDHDHQKTPKNIDVLFTSVSAATVSSMATLEMEIFSDSQLLILIILIIAGGEIFISLLTLQFQRFKLYTLSKQPNSSFELVSFSGSEVPNQKPENQDLENSNISSIDSLNLKLRAIKSLGFVGLGYFLVVQTCGYLLITTYTSLVPSITKILSKKGLNLRTFSMFTIVSTFANCGFLPTNENMIVFKKNSGLLMILIPQILLGNSLYGPSLRFLIWVLEKFTKREEYSYILRSSSCEIGYTHLMPRVRCWFIVMTVFGFIAVQFVVFCCLEWNSSPLMDGMNVYEKIVAVIFQVVNSRHTGESVFDLSGISPAILVIFLVMMYLPPYTSYLPIDEDDELVKRSGQQIRKNKKVVPHLLFSQLSYLVIVIILICIVEAEKLKNDPLNFNVFNITLEVISAYGNVGFSSGYSCERQIKAESSCKNEWTGFVGKWSNLGKLILILVMFFGKLKKFNKHGGQSWNLS